jgi:uncharacterized protein (TIGR02147 family)
MRPSGARTLKTDQQEYFNKWYYSAIRELVSLIDISDNYKQIAESLIPPISAQEVSDAIGASAPVGIYI